MPNYIFVAFQLLVEGKPASKTFAENGFLPKQIRYMIRQLHY